MSERAGIVFLFSNQAAGKRENRCHLCLRKRKLSKEHVPPQSAFNDARATWERFNPTSGSLDERGEWHGPPQTIPMFSRGGFYVNTLCSECNNSTGGTSAQAYVRFVRSLSSRKPLLNASGNRRIVTVNEDPSLIARQLAVMLLAVEDVRFAQKHESFRLFAFGKRERVTPPFKFYAFLVPKKPNAGTIVPFHARVPSFAPGWGATAGEISQFPFGFVYADKLEEKYRPETLGDITAWFSDPPTEGGVILSTVSRLTVLDSMHCCLGNPRRAPQVERIPNA
jgi:hypothetical protein